MPSPLDTQKIWKYFSVMRLVRYLLLFSLAWAIAQVLAYFSHVLVIFIFAGILAFLLNFPVVWLCRWMPRWLATLVTFAFALLLLGGLAATLGFALLSQAQQLLQQAPGLLESAIDLLENLQAALQARDISIDFTIFETQVRRQALEFINLGFTALQTILFNLVDLFLVVIVAFFMLLDGRRLWRLLLRLFPPQLRGSFATALQKNSSCKFSIDRLK